MTTSSEKTYFNLHITGLGYLNRIREVTPKKGESFLACDIAAINGPSNGSVIPGLFSSAIRQTSPRCVPPRWAARHSCRNRPAVPPGPGQRRGRRHPHAGALWHGKKQPAARQRPVQLHDQTPGLHLQAYCLPVLPARLQPGLCLPALRSAPATLRILFWPDDLARQPDLWAPRHRWCHHAGCPTGDFRLSDADWFLCPGCGRWPPATAVYVPAAATARAAGARCLHQA